MYGAQDIFDENRGDTTKWNVDGCLDSLSRKGKPASIVVAVDDKREEKQDSASATFFCDTFLPMPILPSHFMFHNDFQFGIIGFCQKRAIMT